MSDSFVDRIEYGEVILNNIPLMVIGSIGFEITNIYGRKIHQGDPGPNDHPVDSTISQESHQGGIGTLIYSGDDDRGNCWFSTAWMQTSRLLSLPPKTFSQTVVGQENAYVFPHDKLSGTMYGTFGTHLLKWNETVDAWQEFSPGKTVPAAAVNSGVTWGDATTPKALYIPCGSSYAKFDGTTVSSANFAGGKTAKSLTIWDEKLFGMTNDGEVYVTVDGSTWTLKGTLTAELTPQNLFVWFDRDNEPQVHMATSGRIFGLDYLNSLVRETPLWFPDHPTQGLGAEQWRADLYISAGVGIFRQSNGLIQPVGPDNRDGLPAEFANGYIRHLAGGFNELYAAVVGDEIAFTPAEETSDVGVGIPDLMLSQVGDRYGMVMGWNGFGWHPRYVGNVELTTVRTVSVDGVYRLFWGGKGVMFWQELPRGYYNPEFDTAYIPLERTARHITPYYNWGMVDSPKIIKYFEMKTRGCTYQENPDGSRTPLDYLEVYYRIDDEADWTPLRSVQQNNPIVTNGQQRILIGFDSIGGNIYHCGLEHEKIQFMIDFTGDPASDLSTPLVDWYTIVGRKWMRTVKVWTFQVDLAASAAYKGVDTLTLRNQLEAIAEGKQGVPLVIGNEFHVVDVTTDSGNQEASLNWNAYHNITCVQFIEEDNE